MVADNKSLGNFILDGIPPAPRGIPQIEVVFDIDVNGILKVVAKDKASGRQQDITITASSGLSKDEVERMRSEAASHADEDRKRKEQIDIHNQADNLIYAAEKALKDYGDKISADVKAEVEQAIANTKAKMNQDDPEGLRAAMDSLSQAIQRIGGGMYGSDGPQPGVVL
jgi:molecular chaperone DnaK